MNNGYDNDSSFSKEEEGLKLVKLQAEIDKIKAETEALNQSPFRQPSTWIPLATALMGIITTSYGWYDSYLKNQASATELEETRTKEAGIESYSKGLENRLEELENQQSFYVDQLESLQEEIPDFQVEVEPEAILSPDTSVRMPEAAAPIPISKLPRKVAIQYKGSLMAENMKELQDVFNSMGIPTTPPERIEEPYDNSVRFFYSEDQEAAKLAAQTVRDYFEEMGCPIKLTPRYLEVATKGVRQGTIEVWINHTCVSTIKQ